MELFTVDQIRQGAEAYQANEPRDAMYWVTSQWVQQYWPSSEVGEPSWAEVANGLGVLLLTWNMSYYRFGPLDLQQLEQFLIDFGGQVMGYRPRQITSLTPADEAGLRPLLNAALLALARVGGPPSPVSVAKALNPLAPDFFPLWDRSIAEAFVGTVTGMNFADQYIAFMNLTKTQIDQLIEDWGSWSNVSDQLTIDSISKPLLKRLDENNYARYTYPWVTSP